MTDVERAATRTLGALVDEFEEALRAGVDEEARTARKQLVELYHGLVAQIDFLYELLEGRSKPSLH